MPTIITRGGLSAKGFGYTGNKPPSFNGFSNFATPFGFHSFTPAVVALSPTNAIVIAGYDASFAGQTTMSLDGGVTWSTPISFAAASCSIQAIGISLTNAWTIFFVANDGFIYHTRSTDNGVSWSTPTRFSVSPPATSNAIFVVNVATNPTTGTMVAIGNSGAYPSSYYPYYVYSTDHGATWSTPANMGSAGATPISLLYPIIPIPNSSAFVATATNSSSVYALATTSSDGTTWTTPTAMSGTSPGQTVAGLCVDNNGTVWSIGNNAGFSINSSTNNGATWTTTNVLSVLGTGYNIVCNKLNQLVVVGVSYSTYDVVYSLYNGSTWNPAVSITNLRTVSYYNNTSPVVLPNTRTIFHPPTGRFVIIVNVYNGTYSGLGVSISN